jgi:antitoxin component YwqK of YwqJK toxin-antitoxin module
MDHLKPASESHDIPEIFSFEDHVSTEAQKFHKNTRGGTKAGVSVCDHTEDDITTGLNTVDACLFTRHEAEWDFERDTCASVHTTQHKRLHSISGRDQKEHGKTEKIVCYRDGAIHRTLELDTSGLNTGVSGDLAEYYPGGEVRMTCSVKMGTLRGWQRVYDRHGTVLSLKYHEEAVGNTAVVRSYAVIEGTGCWYQIARTSRLGNLYHGYHHVFHPDGSTKVLGSFAMGKKHGEFHHHDESGRLFSVVRYDNDVNTGSDMFFYDSLDRVYRAISYSGSGDITKTVHFRGGGAAYEITGGRLLQAKGPTLPPKKMWVEQHGVVSNESEKKSIDHQDAMLMYDFVTGLSSQ